MSSGFVSGGTTEAPIQRDDEWLKAQQEIEATRRRKEEQDRQEGGKTLYEVLQGNKAAKQEAFEETIKLKNQFRNLDEDEVEFLDSVLESTREKEAAVKKETTEQLDLFRKQQEEADKALLQQDKETDEAKDVGSAGSPTAGENQWAVNAKKRKRAKEKEGLKGLKLRKSSTTEPATASNIVTQESNGSGNETATTLTLSATGSVESRNSTPISKPFPPAVEKPGANAETSSGKAKAPVSLGLAGYSSEEDD